MEVENLGGFTDVWHLVIQVNESRPTPHRQTSATHTTPASRRGPKSAGPTGKTPGATPKSAKAQEAARQREMARRKLMEAKRQGRQRKLSNEDNNDVEIYVS